jgi:hypothetical protein
VIKKTYKIEFLGDGQEDESLLVFRCFYWGQVILLALQMLGLLGNPLVTLLYLVE